MGGRLAKMNYQAMAMLKEREPQASVASWAFRFAGDYDNVLTVLSGMTYMEHLQDNIRTYSPLIPLTEEENEYLYETASIMEKSPSSSFSATALAIMMGAHLYCLAAARAPLH